MICLIPTVFIKFYVVIGSLLAELYVFWFPSCIILLVKQCLWCKCKDNPDCGPIATAYCAITARCKYRIKQFEMRKKQRVIDSKNTGTFIRYVNKRLTCERGIGALRNKHNATIVSDCERANLLNEYFCASYTEDNGITPPFERVVSNDMCIDDIEFYIYIRLLL